MKLFKDPASCKEQMFLIPASVNDFVPANSEARLVGEIIDTMDLSDLYAKYKGGGAPAYEPKMMLKVLVFGYFQGIRSCRRIDAALGQDMRFMFLAEMVHPDFRTINDFRRANLDTIEKTFKETVRIGMEMGLVLLQHVSVDGTKLEANVSGHETYSKKRVDKMLAAIDKRIAEILAEVEKVEQEEDAAFGSKRGDELSEELKDTEKRKQRLQEAKQAMEAINREAVGMTDRDSRVMKTKSGNRPAYNGQAVSDSESQFIVAARVVQDESDNAQLAPMIEEAKLNTGAIPAIVTADGGYRSQKSLEYVESENLDGYIPNAQPEDLHKGFTFDEEKDAFICPLGKSLLFSRERVRDHKRYRIYRCYRCSNCPDGEKCHGTSCRYKELWRRMNGDLQEAMSAKMKTESAKDIYRQRKQIVEPVFGNIKANHGMKRLLLRGLEGAGIEYLLACIGHNLGKLMRTWTAQRPQLARISA